MINLKAIITQLDDVDFNTLMSSLGGEKKTNYSLLLKAYRDVKLNDEHIVKKLKLTTASFYTLKSRLYDKIQSFLLKISDGNKYDILQQVASIPELCYSTPRETAIAILNKLEQNLIKLDMPAHLVQVYSALKKVSVYTPKYYYYSQLFNKHLAYTVALEKAEELLHNFNKSMADYFYSKNSTQLDLLKLIGKEVNNIFELNKSNQIELIKNNILIQL